MESTLINIAKKLNQMWLEDPDAVEELVMKTPIVHEEDATDDLWDMDLDRIREIMDGEYL